MFVKGEKAIVEYLKDIFDWPYVPLEEDIESGQFRFAYNTVLLDVGDSYGLSAIEDELDPLIEQLEQKYPGMSIHATWQTFGDSSCNWIVLGTPRGPQ